MELFKNQEANRLGEISIITQCNLLFINKRHELRLIVNKLWKSIKHGK